MRQLQEEAQKTRQSELRRQKEVAQLKKQERMKDNKIRTLETDKKKKETILKRKLEEVAEEDYHIQVGMFMHRLQSCGVGGSRPPYFGMGFVGRSWGS